MTDILHADLSSGTNLTSPTLPLLSSLSLSFPPSEKKTTQINLCYKKMYLHDCTFQMCYSGGQIVCRVHCNQRNEGLVKDKSI